MTKTIAAVAAVLIAAGGTAWAQNANNPAPNYPSMQNATPSTDAPPLVDSNNPAPKYPSSASTNPRTDAAPIADKNNPAPTYGAAAAAPAKHVRKRAVAHSRHHKVPHAS